MAKYAPARRKMAAYRAALEDISARSSDPLPAILRTRRNNLLSLARLEAVLEDPTVDLSIDEIRSFGELNIALGSFELAICDRLQAIEAQRREAVTDGDRAARQALPGSVGADDDGGEWDVVADPSEGEGPSGTG